MNINSMWKELRPGCIVGTTSFSVLGTIIRWREAGIGKVFSPHVASHIAVIRSVGVGQVTGYEMTVPHIRKVEWGMYDHGLSGNHIVFVAMPGLSIDGQRDAMKFLDSEYARKRPYDGKSLFEAIGIGNDDPKKSNCAELGRDTLRSAGYHYPLEWDQGVEPWEMQRHFEATKEIIWRSYKKFWG